MLYYICVTGEYFAQIIEKTVNIKEVKVKSIQGKFVTIIISGMLILALSISILSVFYISQILDNDSDIITESVAKAEALKINKVISDVENSVETMRHYVTSTIESVDNIKNTEYRNEYLLRAKDIFCAIAEESKGTLAFYMRFAPEVSDNQTGFYLGRATSSASFEDMPPRDLADWENSPWYAEPKNTGAPVWLLPYEDSNLRNEIISYVVPVYKDHQFIGVIGVDFEFSELTKMVTEVSVYNNGFAFLTNKNRDSVYFSPVDDHMLNRVQTHHGFAEEAMSLDNGMVLIIHADYSDIQRDSYQVVTMIVAIVLILMIAFTVITYYLTVRIVRPLKKLTKAAELLAEGETDLHLESCETADEICVLTKAFERTAEKLNTYMSCVKTLAYKDSLTGVKNRTAYNEMTTELDVKLKIGYHEPFALLTADVNYLKQTNDKYGHEVGNRIIVKAAKIICDVFKRSPVYRIGGDEFVVMMTGDDLANYNDLLREMDVRLEENFIIVDGDHVPISIARAIAVFDPVTDVSVEDVFNRADQKMYEHKKQVKGLK